MENYIKKKRRSWNNFIDIIDENFGNFSIIILTSLSWRRLQIKVGRKKKNNSSEVLKVMFKFCSHFNKFIEVYV